MELWIRSQDKEILQKTNALFIAHSDENIWSIIDNQNMTKYGEYTTRERAIEVLDEIQNILKPKYILDSSSIKPNGDSWVENGIVMQNYNANARIEELSIYVYEMPKD